MTLKQLKSNLCFTFSSDFTRGLMMSCCKTISPEVHIISGLELQPLFIFHLAAAQESVFKSNQHIWSLFGTC